MTHIAIVTGDVVDSVGSTIVRKRCNFQPRCLFSRIIKQVYNTIAWDYRSEDYVIYRGDSFWGAFIQHPEMALLNCQQFQKLLAEVFSAYGISGVKARFTIWYGDVDTSHLLSELNFSEAFLWSDKTLIQMKDTPSIIVTTNIGDSFTYEELSCIN